MKLKAVIEEKQETKELRYHAILKRKITDELLMQRLLTWNLQFNLLRHGSSQPVRSVAPVFTLILEEVFFIKHKRAVCSVCWDVGRDKVFAIFCPSVSVGAK